MEDIKEKDDEYRVSIKTRSNSINAVSNEHDFLPDLLNNNRVSTGAFAGSNYARKPSLHNQPIMERTRSEDSSIMSEKKKKRA